MKAHFKVHILSGNYWFGRFIAYSKSTSFSLSEHNTYSLAYYLYNCGTNEKCSCELKVYYTHTLNIGYYIL